MLTVYEPWRTQIYHHCLRDELDLDALLTESLTLPPTTVGGKVDERSIDAQAPLLMQVRKAHILPRVLTYLRSCYGWEGGAEALALRSWVVNYRPGQTMAIHNHANAQVSTVLYLESTGGDIVFLDPRGNAARAYPSLIRDQAFANFSFTPTSGDLLIFPSYLYHHVEGNAQGLRVVMPTDVFLLD